MKKIAILGSGNTGCDLQSFKKRRDASCFICGASSKLERIGVAATEAHTDRSIEGVLEDGERPDILIDCTSAAHHQYNYDLCKENGIRIIDMTPAKLGITCCPVVNLDECLKSDNINMISCGGQASIPICQAIKQVNPGIEYIEIVSTISSASAGPGTRKNISQYISATEKAIRKVLDIASAKAIINITPAIPPVHMKTSILIDSKSISSISETQESIENMIAKVQAYSPGYCQSINLKD